MLPRGKRQAQMAGGGRPRLEPRPHEGIRRSLSRESNCYIVMIGETVWRHGLGEIRANGSEAALSLHGHSWGQFEGTLYPFLMDDKGLTAVCGFGLPPLAHGNDPRRALEAGIALHEELGRRPYLPPSASPRARYSAGPPPGDDIPPIASFGSSGYSCRLRTRLAMRTA